MRKRERYREGEKERDIGRVRKRERGTGRVRKRERYREGEKEREI